MNNQKLENVGKPFIVWREAKNAVRCHGNGAHVHEGTGYLANILSPFCANAVTITFISWRHNNSRKAMEGIPRLWRIRINCWPPLSGQTFVTDAWRPVTINGERSSADTITASRYAKCSLNSNYTCTVWNGNGATRRVIMTFVLWLPVSDW